MLTGQILRISEFDKDLQADDADDCDEEADTCEVKVNNLAIPRFLKVLTKHQHDPKLLPLVQLHLPQTRQWQTQRENVQDQIESSRSPALRIDIVASSLVLSMPSLPRHGNRPALKDRNEDESYTIGDVETNDGIASNPEVLSREDAKVCEQQRYLDGGESRKVEIFVPVVDLHQFVSKAAN